MEKIQHLKKHWLAKEFMFTKCNWKTISISLHILENSASDVQVGDTKQVIL